MSSHDASAAVRRTLAGRDGPLAAAVALALLGVVEAPLHGGASDRPAIVLSSLLAALPLALVRIRLGLAAGTVTAVLLWTLVGGVPVTMPALAAQLAVAYLVATRRRLLASVALAAPFALVAPSGEQPKTVFVLALVVAAQAVGYARRQQRAAVVERDVAVRDQVALEERARIARELHDVVAHHVSMIAVQAETARLTTPGLPDEGRERLATIGATAREALTEMRRLLGVLRADDAAAERAPQPGLARLDELLDAGRAAGTPVRLTLHGRRAPLPAGVDLTAYRLVQEALSNARRHAPRAGVELELVYRPDTLQVRVRDTGPGWRAATTDGRDLGGHDPATAASTAASATGGGQGLLGMRERVAMVGGRLWTGPADGGGFAVEADLPLER